MSASTVSGALACLRMCSPMDLVVISYTILVTLLIVSFRQSKTSYETMKGAKYRFQRSTNSSSNISTYNGKRGDPAVNWKKSFEGVWLQYREENFDEFLKFSGTSFALRKVIPVAFFMTRHTLTVTSRTVESEEVDGEKSTKVEEYFTVKRDFGEGVREWTLSMKMGKDKESAETVQAVIDTDEEYIFQNWSVEESGEICTLSTPVGGVSGVRCLQTRTLASEDEIRMVSDLCYS